MTVLYAPQTHKIVIKYRLAYINACYYLYSRLAIIRVILPTYLPRVRSLKENLKLRPGRIDLTISRSIRQVARVISASNTSHTIKIIKHWIIG